MRTAPGAAGGVGHRLLGIGDEGAAAPADQVRLHRLLGWSALELRTLDGVPLHDVHDATHRALADQLDAAGMGVPVLDTPVGGWSVDVGTSFETELRTLERYVELARLYGAGYLRVMSYPGDGRDPSRWRDEAIRRVGALARVAGDSGVVLLHENCHGWASSGPQATLELLAEVGTEHLGLLFDTGNGISYGYDSVEFLAPVIEHVRHVHLKDSVHVDGRAAFVPPGEGESRVAECVRMLEGSGYRGLYSIEPHLHLVPHESRTGKPSAMADAYVDYGRSAAALLAAAGVREVTGADT